jgi:hypothetical protein
MQPGRSCPLHYRYSPKDFAREADFQADTLYVIGGLYGNVPALETVRELAARESSPVTLAFNGDFNWFNIDDPGFRAINSAVLHHHAIRGNVETEIAHDDDGDQSAGCGCGYPDWVGASEVERSNLIINELRHTAQRHADLREQLAMLPMHLVAQVGNVRVAIVHGDLESLAGWSLSQEALTDDGAINTAKKQIVTSQCRIVASSHTCLPVAMSFDTAHGQCAVFNNGASGMPNFRDAPFGVITRISTTSSEMHPGLYGTRIGGVYVDALALEYDNLLWQNDFLRMWPKGSAAHVSYHERTVKGPDYAMMRAIRF